MSDVGLQLAIKRVRHDWWRLYEISQSERFGPFAKVLRDSRGRIASFHSEENAREFIGSMPDAVEVDYPA